MLTASSTSQHLSRRGYRLSLAAILLVALLGVVLYAFEGARQVNGFGFPLDDSWIHLQIARNLASGHGWSFNPGEPTSASTAPLWVLLITPLFYLGGDVTVWVKVLGSLLFIATVLLVADVASLATGDRRVGVLAGALTALQPVLIWTALSGMETGLYLLFFLLSLRSLFLIERHGPRAAYASTVWLTLAGFARPELWALLPVIWGYLLWRRRELSVGRWWVHVGIALLGLGGFALFNMALWNHPVPATLIAKRAYMRDYNEGSVLAGLRAFAVRLIYNVDQTLRSTNVVLLGCMAAGLIAVQRRHDALAKRLLVFLSIFGVGIIVISFVNVGRVAFHLLTCMAAGLIAVQHRRDALGKRLLVMMSIIGVGVLVVSLVNVGGVSFQWYRRAAFILVCMNVLVAFGFVATYEAMDATSLEPGLRRDETPRGKVDGFVKTRRALVIMGYLALMALLVQIAFVLNCADLYVNDVRSINEADVASGRWLATHTPPDALIAANDIGAIAYFSQRRILDMIGLASPEALAVLRQTQFASPERDRKMKELLLEKQAAYVVIFPTWFPYLVNDPMLHEVQRFVVQKSTSFGGEEVVIFEVAKESK